MKYRKQMLILAIPAAAVLLAAAVAFCALRQPGADISSGGAASDTPAVYDPYPAPEKTVAVNLPAGVSAPAAARGKYFYVNQNESWNCTFLKGVDIGLTLPDTDLANPNVPYGTYLAWFGQIRAMNANTVRVFTIMNPEFYAALDDYNTAHADAPLYLMHGVWFNEDYMESVGDAFGGDGKIGTSLIRAAKEAADIIHGNSHTTSYGQWDPAVYDRDVSRYVVGWILGLEWRPEFVEATNRNHAGMAQYAGEYLTTENAAPFEIFLAEAGEALLSYETETYGSQRPLAFLNWATTDNITHTNEPFPEEDAVSVDTGRIRAAGRFGAGLFAAVDAYPYYPEFMNHQPDYVNYADPSGKQNPYRAYLMDLVGRSQVPVVVAEFGLPTSRGAAHESVTGYHQGGMEEAVQGEALAAMFRDIARAGCAGGLAFSWQDEWFKQTWNTYKYAAKNAALRPFNVQSAEQRYGILAMEPGGNESICYPDGDRSDWRGDTPALRTAGGELYIKSDAAYLYLLIASDADFETERLAVPLSLTGRGSPGAPAEGLRFSAPADFLLILNGQTGSRLKTDAYYDLFYYTYDFQKGIFGRKGEAPLRGSGIFNPIRQFLSNEIVTPLDGKTIPPKAYEAGLLRYGNANPASESYDSMADFCFGDGFAEVRVPWALLNVASPLEGKRLGDFYENGGVQPEDMGELLLGLWIEGESGAVALEWADPRIPKTNEYHGRLKKSYYILREALPEIMPGY